MHNVNAAGMSKSTAPGLAIQLASVISEYGAALVDKQTQCASKASDETHIRT